MTNQNSLQLLELLFLDKCLEKLDVLLIKMQIPNQPNLTLRPRPFFNTLALHLGAAYCNK